MEAVTDHLPIPHHITDLPVIDPDQAAELAIQFELADPDDKNAALIGLHYCRDRQITPETALEQGAQELNLDTLIAPFTQSKDDLKPIIKSETQRIKKRDQSIFALEQSFHGLNQPFPKSIRDLNQLCQH